MVKSTSLKSDKMVCVNKLVTLIEKSMNYINQLEKVIKFIGLLHGHEIIVLWRMWQEQWG